MEEIQEKEGKEVSIITHGEEDTPIIQNEQTYEEIREIEESSDSNDLNDNGMLKLKCFF